jgi:hypothetical protein
MTENDISTGDWPADGAVGLTFADVIAPVSAEQFFAEYHGRKILHVRGAADKFAGVMSWARLNALLNMTAVCRGHSKWRSTALCCRRAITAALASTTPAAQPACSLSRRG